MSKSNLIELSESHIEQVSGGSPALIPLGIAAFTGAVAGGINDGWGGVLRGAAFGPMTGGAGAMMNITTGIVRAGWGLKTIVLGVAGGTAGGGGGDKPVKGGDFATRLSN